MGIVTALATFLSPDLTRTAFAFCVLGVASHQCIRHGEIDNRLRPLSALYLLAFLGLCLCYVRIFSLSWPRALGETILAASSFNLGLLTSIITYRAFFHRLRHFPGPWMAKVTRISAVLKAVERTQYHLDLKEMHRKYGDFVRTGPREISVNRPSAVYLTSGPHSVCTKPTWYSHVSDDITKVSLNSTRDPEVHRRRRRAWDRGFSMKALPTYEPRLQHKVDVLVSQIRSRIDRPLNITQWTMYLAFDVMGLVGFSKDFRQLEDAVEHAAIEELHGQMLMYGILRPVPWVLTILGATLGLAGKYGQFMTYCVARTAERKAEWNASEDKVPQDVISWLFKASDEKDQSAPPGEQALNEDGQLLIITGSDTTSGALANAFYYLAKHPAVYKKLQAELDNAFSSGKQSPKINNETLRKLPYLEAIINETLRLKPAVPSGQPRQTPPQGLQIDEVWMPGDTIIIVPQYVIQRDDRYFPSGDEFIPERWLDEKDSLIKHEEAFFPFQLGRYGCVGKQLALMEMRLVIARIAMEFDLAFAPGETGEAFDRDAKDTFTFNIGPLMLDFKPRSA
ncbi:protein CYP671A1 [Aspergillus nidulans FGSC A4]|uniref:Cytochrome P450, putative (Eurofung) n=1 Tax=Emericella nidulans (strain FGSC A4 / ATCC 38163 / CBS 112.46 / NRRL 194 / M139) TaxID=227321 RepID=C8VE31_EMENI|nr:protein CYP671A1 [Aspergillus nidulans FGSC A4]CBF80338.1 TPA: cytochrome P450, putative (Eurofung) [Aspergillus nidulans FGSC A4]